MFLYMFGAVGPCFWSVVAGWQGQGTRSAIWRPLAGEPRVPPDPGPPLVTQR
jgi:hypothetical protein